MGRNKGTPTQYYTKETKKRIIKEALDIGINPTARNNNISPGMVCSWVKAYKNNGDKIVDNKYKRNNPLSKYINKKDLTHMEKLEYENMKLRIENERLKKGYLVKEDGQIVVFDMKKYKSSK